MYNSDDQAQEENRFTESNPQEASEDTRNERPTYSRPKNIMNLTQKSVGIYGTYSRIVPKKPTYDVERLYAENIQLKEKIKFL